MPCCQNCQEGPFTVDVAYNGMMWFASPIFASEPVFISHLPTRTRCVQCVPLTCHSIDFAAGAEGQVQFLFDRVKLSPQGILSQSR